MKIFSGKSKEEQAEKVEGSDAGGQSANAAPAGTSGTGDAGAGAKDAASGASASGGGAGAGATPPPGGGAGGRMTPKKIVVAVVGVLLLLWLVGTVIGFFETSDTAHVARNENIADIEDRMEPEHDRHSVEPAGHGEPAGGDHSAAGDAQSAGHAPATSHTPSGGDHASASHSADTTSSHDTHGATADSHSSKATSHDTATRTKTTSSHGDSADHGEQATSHAPAAEAHGAKTHVPRRPGIATTEAIIQPLAYELEERWWGWRPNDVINITDNVNNYQFGVLEVTRRATVALAERLARTGSTASYDVNLERAMNWFMVKADAYWFPSAESKYKEGLDELRAYKARLEGGGGQFWTRPDNLIPMLASFEDLLGSCDENLVKTAEDDGSHVGFSEADDYFYYTQGVANSMLVILEALHEDFHATLETRRSTEILHHAILSLHHATEIQPWLIMESDLGSIFANHRANLAAPISHARFYVGLLIKALST